MQVTLPDGIESVKISASSSNADFFIVVQTTSDYLEQNPNSFDITFDPDADSLNWDEAEDTSVSVQDSLPT